MNSSALGEGGVKACRTAVPGLVRGKRRRLVLASGRLLLSCRLRTHVMPGQTGDLAVAQFALVRVSAPELRVRGMAQVRPAW